MNKITTIERDTVFDEYLKKQLDIAPFGLAHQAARVARAAYYGTHWRLLFPTDGDYPVESAGSRGTFQQTLTDEAIELGERYAERFCTEHPERVNKYRTVYKP